MNEIQQADPRARRRAVLVFASASAVGLIFIFIFEKHRAALGDWITRDPEQAVSRLKLAFGILALFIAGPILGFAVYLWRLGSRTVAAERFPPPGVAVVRDTVVLRHNAARHRGWLARIGAVVLALAGCILALLLWKLANLLAAIR